jgi:hypothetical protein
MLHILDYGILLALGLWLFFAVRSMLKPGHSCCGSAGGCAGCSGCCGSCSRCKAHR